MSLIGCRRKNVPSETTVQEVTTSEYEKEDVTEYEKEEYSVESTNEESDETTDDGPYSNELTSVDAEEYFDEHSNVISTVSFNDSSDVTIGGDTLKSLQSKGFDQTEVLSDYDEDGDINEKEITEDTTEKYPIYYTYYITEKDELWTILVVNGKITANPVSYNMNSKLPAQLILSESESIMSYDAETNTYFETIPDPDVLIVKVVPEINAELLEELTFEGIDAL